MSRQQVGGLNVTTHKSLAEFTEIGKDNVCKVGLSINLKGK
jgi:hypothetical protein